MAVARRCGQRLKPRMSLEPYSSTKAPWPSRPTRTSEWRGWPHKSMESCVERRFSNVTWDESQPVRLAPRPCGGTPLVRMCNPYTQAGPLIGLIVLPVSDDVRRFPRSLI
ncbi:protein of unknown function [Streptomyces sp. KY75]|nr:protein of unknown function [Streptomyces sp. KY70]CAD5988291.1 protein of unknown function [Streptomyces sp. KY75]